MYIFVGTHIHVHVCSNYGWISLQIVIVKLLNVMVTMFLGRGGHLNPYTHTQPPMDDRISLEEGNGLHYLLCSVQTENADHLKTTRMHGRFIALL